MEFNFETNIPQPPKKGNRILAYTLGFLFLFSIGTYAFGAALYHPGDTNDPSCAPGDAGCYVSVFPDDTGHGGQYLTTDGAGNASWSAVAGGSTPTLQDVLNTGATTDGAHPILGQNFLQFDATNEKGILNSGGSEILGTDSRDNVFLTGYNLSHAANGTVGFDSSGDVTLSGSSVIGHVPISGSVDATSTIGVLNFSDLATALDGTFNMLDDRTFSRQDVIGVTITGFGNYGDSSLLVHADSSRNYAATVAFDKSGTPNLTTVAVNNGGVANLSTSVTPTEYKISSLNTGTSLDINASTRTYSFGDVAGGNNSTKLVLNDASNTATIGGYLNTSTPPTVGAVTFNGSGTNNLTPSGTFTGALSATFVVAINQVNRGNPFYSSKTGTFTAGETMTVTSGAGAGSTATYVSDTGGAPGSILFTNEAVVGSGIAVTSVLTGNTSGATVTISSFGGGLFDMFTWTSSDGGSSGPPVIATSALLADGITVTFGAQTGHHLGDTWTFSYAYPAGKMLSLDGQHGAFSIGDVDGIKNGTKLKVDDVAQTVSITGSGGTCTSDGSTGWTCFSDERLKTDVVDLPDTLGQIDQLRPVNYMWIDPSMPQTLNTGLIAQEVQQIFPDLVSQVGSTGYLGVNYDGLIVPAVKAIQELDMKVEPLTSIDPTVNGSLASLIMQFLQNAIVTIKEATIGTLHIGDQVCADDVCVTKEQFKNLLLQAGGTSDLNAPPADPTTTTATSSDTSGDSGTTDTTGGTPSTSSGSSDSSSTSSGSDSSGTTTTTTSSDTTDTSDSSGTTTSTDPTDDSGAPAAPVTPPSTDPAAAPSS